MATLVSERGKLRQQIWAMSPEQTEEFLKQTIVVRVGTVDSEGYPYVVPQLFVYEPGKVWIHQTSATGHLRRNIEFNPKVCLEFDEYGEFFPYGATQCDTVVAYRSVIAFGTLRVVTDPDEKIRFFDQFMIKYAGASWGREEHTYPPDGDISSLNPAVNHVDVCAETIGSFRGGNCRIISTNHQLENSQRR